MNGKVRIFAVMAFVGGDCPHETSCGLPSKATPITIETQGVEIGEGRAIAKFVASGKTQTKSRRA